MTAPDTIEAGPFIKSIEKALESCSSGRAINPDGLNLPPMEIDTAAVLDLQSAGSQDKHPLSSSSPVSIEGEEAGELHIVTIGPGQTIGEALSKERSDVPTILPALGRDLIHLPISTHRSVGVPCAFVNNLDLVRLDDDGMHRLGTLGQSYYRFLSIVENGWFAEIQQPELAPTEAYHVNGSASDTPNAIHNPHPRFTQVSGFLALSSSLSEHARLFDGFMALPPKSYS